MKNYICVIRYSNGEIVKKVDVTGMAERMVDKVDRGMNINLNHDEFYTTEMNDEELKEAT
jgi:hypothetical protein